MSLALGPLGDTTQGLETKLEPNWSRKGAITGAMANGRFVEKGPLVGMYARQVDGRAVSLGLLCCDWLC